MMPAPQTTEAEALLKSGALYPVRIGLQGPSGPLLFAGFKHGAFSIYEGDEPSSHYDLEGRWQRAYIDPCHDVKRLDGTVHAIERPRRGRQMTLARRVLNDEEVTALDDRLRTRAAELLDQLRAGAFKLVAPPNADQAMSQSRLEAMLEAIARWDADAWKAHRQRIRNTYGPIGLVPPDCQNALVLQATIGHRNGRAFGKEDSTPIQERSAEAFTEHCRDVADILGAGVVPYRHLLLTGPDLLRKSADEIIDYATRAVAEFPLADRPAPARRSELPIDRPHRESLQFFDHDFEGPHPDPSLWPKLKAMGLGRVSIGVETGGTDIPGYRSSPHDEVRRRVADIKESGVAVSILTLLGPGGHLHRQEHENGTIALLEFLDDLGSGDHIYFIEAAEIAEGNETDPLSFEEIQAQERLFLDRLAPLRKQRKVKVLPYRYRKQMV